MVGGGQVGRGRLADGRGEAGHGDAGRLVLAAAAADPLKEETGAEVWWLKSAA